MRYSAFLHETGALWRIETAAPGLRPYLDRSTDEMTLATERTITPSARPVARHLRNEINLHRRGDLWGFSYSLDYETGSSSHGGFMKFCPPYPSETAAILAAAEKVEDYAGGANDWHGKTYDGRGKPMKPGLRALIEWAEELRASCQQTSLF